MEKLSLIEIITAIVFMITQLADIWTTIKCLEAGATEGNPVVAWIMRKLGKLWPLVKLALSVGGAYLLWSDGVIWGVWLLCAVVGAVAVSNYRILKDRQRRGL
mgnify:CR=1 FL=1